MLKRLCLLFVLATVVVECGVTQASDDRPLSQLEPGSEITLLSDILYDPETTATAASELSTITFQEGQTVHSTPIGKSCDVVISKTNALYRKGSSWTVTK